MDTNSIECTKRGIRAVVAGSSAPEDPLHAERTLAWLLRLEPDADVALQIAALGHDIERAVEATKVRRVDFPDYDTFKAAHARSSAGILKGIMEDCGLPQDKASEVHRLVCLHETGGEPRADLIKDADCISFFEVNLPLYYERHNRDEVLKRCIWGYRRLSKKRRKIMESFSYVNVELNALLKEAMSNASAHFDSKDRSHWLL